MRFEVVLPALTALLAAGGEGVAQERASYDMHVRVRPAEQRIEVAGTVTFPPASQPRDSLRLVLTSMASDVRFDVDRAKGGPATVTTDDAEGDRTWIVHPRAPVAPGRRVAVRFSYAIRNAAAPQLAADSVVSYAGGGGEVWYPRMAFDSLTLGTIRFRVPADQVVLATGTLLRRRRAGDETEYVFEAREPVHFAFASARYRVYEAPGTPAVRLYLLSDRPDADSLARRVSGILTSLTDLFGPLPYDPYAVAEVRFRGAVGGTSEAGFFLANSSYIDQGLPIPFIAHEIGHAWWGNRVGTKPAPGRMMLTEGLASLGMLWTLRDVEGDSAWTRYRRSAYPGYRISGSAEEFFRLAAAELDLPIVTAIPTGGEILRMHRTVNTKGLFVLDMLSRVVGEASFKAFLREIARRYAGERLTFAEFWSGLEAHAGSRLDWFREQWLERTGAPEYALAWRREGDVVAGEITQTPPLYRASLELALIDVGGRARIETLDVAGERTSFRFRAPPGFERVVLDPRNLVLRWTPETRRRALALEPYTRADWVRRFGNRDTAIALFERALDSLPAPDTVGLEMRLRYGLAQALLAKGELAEARAQAQRALSAPARPYELLPWTYVLAARIANRLGQTTEAAEAFRAALTADLLGGGESGAAAAVHAELRR